MKTRQLAYPAILHAEPEGGFSVAFSDFPSAHTQGENLTDAFEMAVDCLQATIEYALEDKEQIPPPSRLAKGQILIPVSLELAPKVALQQAMREADITNVALAELLHVGEVVVRRMLNPKHQSKASQYVRALGALGLMVQVHIKEIEPPKA